MRRRAFEHQRANLTTEPDHFLALVARQSIAATSIIEIGLPNPVADRLGRRLELLCQLFGLPLRSSSVRRRRNSSGYGGGGAAFFGIVVTSDPKAQGGGTPQGRPATYRPLIQLTCGCLPSNSRTGTLTL